MTPSEIRAHYLARLRSLYRLIAKINRLYPTFPDASPDTWRAEIATLAAYIKSAPDEILEQMAGSHLALRNLLADRMGIEKHDGTGGTSYGHKVLDISWD